ncbi:MAG: hypothetical protein ACK46X_08130 [Candidatus Sericytochromatia bacterium]
MMTLEALMMVLLATAAVVLAFTKLKCPTASDEHRIAWLPASADEVQAEEESNLLSFRR